MTSRGEPGGGQNLNSAFGELLHTVGSDLSVDTGTVVIRWGSISKNENFVDPQSTSATCLPVDLFAFGLKNCLLHAPTATQW